MNSTDAPTGPRTAVILLFLGTFVVLFAWGSWVRDFWAPEEPLLARVTGEMERGGDWILPRFLGEPHLDVPPLTYWLAAATRRVIPTERLAYRLPSIAFAVLGLWLTYAAGRRLFDGRIGFLALVIQASTFLYYYQAGWFDDGLLFAVSTQLALTGFAIASRRDGGRRWPLLGWLGLAGAALSKSLPLALVLVGLPLVGFLFFEGGIGMLRRGFARARSGPGIVLFVALVLPWYIAAAFREGGGLLSQHVVHQHLERLVSSPLDPEPPYFYLWVLLWGLLPWTLFLPLGLLHGKDRLSRDGERLSFLWIIISAVALSVVSSKKSEYLLHVWPPVALLISAAFFETRESYTIWEEFLREGVFAGVPLILKLPAVLTALLAGLYYGGKLQDFLGDEWKPLLSNTEATTRVLLLVAVVAASAYAISYRIRTIARAKDTPRAAFELACAAAFAFFVGSFAYGPLNAVLSGRPAVEKLLEGVPAEAPLGLYGAENEALVYYLGFDRKLERFQYPDTLKPDGPALKAIISFLDAPRAVYLVASRVELEKLKLQFSSLIPRMKEKAATRLGFSGDFVLVSNQ